MFFAVIFLAELFALFLVSILLTRTLSLFLYRFTKSYGVTIYTMALLFLPGTFIHEVSHFLMAILLFVPVGKMELWPKLDGDRLKLGSLQIARVDIFRRLLIGMAPFFFGTTILLTLFFFAAKMHLFDNKLFIILILYLAFEIGNTMFSSRKDMEGAIEILIFLVLITIIAYFVGFRITSLNLSAFFSQPLISQALEKGVFFLLVPLGIDIVIIFLVRIFVRNKF